MDIKAICPECGKQMMVYVDTSCGIPDKSGSICEYCNTLTVFVVKWEPHIWLGRVKSMERVEANSLQVAVTRTAGRRGQAAAPGGCTCSADADLDNGADQLTDIGLTYREIAAALDSEMPQTGQQKRFETEER
jgi:hypothetical protein